MYLWSNEFFWGKIKSVKIVLHKTNDWFS